MTSGHAFGLMRMAPSAGKIRRQACLPHPTCPLPVSACAKVANPIDALPNCRVNAPRSRAEPFGVIASARLQLKLAPAPRKPRDDRCQVVRVDGLWHEVLFGPRAGAPLRGRFAYEVIERIHPTVSVGANEIQRDTIARFGLQLPVRRR